MTEDTKGCYDRLPFNMKQEEIEKEKEFLMEFAIPLLKAGGKDNGTEVEVLDGQEPGEL